MIQVDEGKLKETLEEEIKETLRTATFTYISSTAEELFGDEEQEYNTDKKAKKRCRKWLKRKRNEYKKFFDEWTPWNCYPLIKIMKKMILDMLEYYARGDNVVGVPTTIDENGSMVECDTRKKTLAIAADKLCVCDNCDDSVDYETEQKMLIDAFTYIAEHMDEWWD